MNFSPPVIELSEQVLLFRCPFFSCLAQQDWEGYCLSYDRCYYQDLLIQGKVSDFHLSYPLFKLSGHFSQLRDSFLIYDWILRPNSQLFADFQNLPYQILFAFA